MEVKEIFEYVKNHASGKVKIAITDIDGVLRGKYISVEKFLSVVDSDTSFCDVIFGWDSRMTPPMIMYLIPAGIPDIRMRLPGWICPVSGKFPGKMIFRFSWEN